MRSRDEQIVMDYKEVSHGNICRWEVPDPFVMSFQGGGSISFFKDGRIDYNIVDPNGAAKDLVSFLETHYQEHILEAERRAEQRVRAEIARDSERLDWIGTQDVVIGEYGGKEQWEEVLLARYQRTLPTDLLDIRMSIDAAREVG